MAEYHSITGIQWGNVDRAVTRRIHRVGRDVYNNAARNLDRHVRTGQLIRSLRFVPLLNAADIFIGTNHWRFIEYGTAPHIIDPDRKEALDWPDALHPYRRVRHPGTREYAPMRRALRQRKR